MELWQAAVLGVVEGLTEYLPVSSTGHILLAQRVLGIPRSEAANAFAIAVQSGAIAAVLGLYRSRVREMLLGVVGRSPEGRRLSLNVLVAFVPAAAIGVVLDKRIERHLFGLWPVVAAWFVGGVAILALHPRFARRDRSTANDLGSLDPRRAAVIGLAQCLAMWPGTSRSLVTLVAGLFVGLAIESAVEFSFLLGLLTLSAATGYKLVKSGGAMVSTYSPASLAVGFVAAAVSAALAVRWMVSWLKSHGIALFAYYRVALSLAVAALLWQGVVAP